MGRGMTAPGVRLPLEVRAALARLVERLQSDAAHVSGLAQAGDAPVGGHADALSAWLYASWYLALPQPDPVEPSGRWRTDLSSALRAALPSGARWLDGWVVLERRHDGQCVVARRGAARVVRPGEYVNRARPGVPAMPGDAVAVTSCLDGVDKASGFWTTRSDADLAAPLVRVHWSVPPSSLPLVVARVAVLLDALAIAYSLKTPATVDGCARIDTLVVYVSATDWPRLDAPVTTLARALGPHLRPWHPPLARPLAPGAAFAEDPGEESFGQRRCRILAGGVRELLAGAPVGAGDAIDHLARCLQAARIDPERPWLNDAG
ncbi:hypothetical protein TBR22_A43380 [Luteitalea sp. TBR-22]|uniref:T3SS effector HopA1 family protein n=1 Tax=Luteitalea sp. TBR-22 TaxID=2802971 RepID=UPI001AF6A9E0|nr:T3SS effector HopA1 family protein [Luteitalea sp. TBR-22]BCS35112.1 hypothetical protein TBR22_A43380 [Luteitalea sp. TBR-22]